ncbi:MAG TPA: hypothetical protein PK725_16650 [Rhodocyclaceae bacterium]|nr:hypothetical protein [Rhodocyclaceae bacterium]
MQLDQQHLVDMASLILEEAETRFSTCGAESDFCVQHVGQNAVFGGTNRLIWSAKHGWRPDRTSCTERFLAEYDAHYGDSK